jgi:TM2 domain-containing membrane protein YozV
MMNMSEPTTQTPAAYCRTCGKPLFEDVRRTENGAAYCPEHFPVEAAVPPEAGAPRFSDSSYSSSAKASGFEPPSAYSDPPAAARPMRDGYAGGLGSVPALAFFLGFIPGVGAIYNGQYAKGLIHAVAFGLMISLIDSNAARGVEPLLGILMAVFTFYMAFEAYHTARKRRDGEAVDEFSSLVHLTGPRVPMAGFALIGLGVLLLLITNDLISSEMFRRVWPAGLILLGVYLLYVRVKGAPSV